MGALTGIRVLDLADESGAYCGKLLADMGADVVKVEPPGGDSMRQIGPFFEDRAHPDCSLFFWHYNTSKRSVVLDLNSDADCDRFLELLDVADVVITTGTPDQLQEQGLEYETLSLRNPRVIVASISGFGLSGPRANWKSCDTIAQATGGMLFVNGHPNEPPLRSFGLQAYHSACTYAAIGVLLALRARERSGRGQQVEVSIQEAVAATVEHVSGFYRQGRGIEVRRGTLHWSRYFRVVKCTDGYALHCTLGDWTSLIEWVKMQGKEQDLGAPQWEDFNHRRRYCEHLFDVLDAWAGEMSVGELVEGAQLRRLPYAAVVPIEEVPRNEQLRARGFFVPVEHDDLGRTLTYPGAPYVMSVTPWRIQRRPPRVGEHQLEVLSEWRSLPLKKSQPMPPEPGRRALDDIRILDFTWVVAGPVATRILADHGAEVVKIERRDSLDFGNRRGGLTGNLNRGKQSVVINMSNPRGIDLVRQLVPRVDIVIDNFSARVMSNWGLTYDKLKELRSDIIAISMSGFGHTGPQKNHVSYGPTLQALSGFTLAMRHPGKEPAGWGFSYADMVAGYTAALAALIALWHRDHTGEGQFIDLSQFEAVTAVIGPTLLDVLIHDGHPQPLGNRSPERPAAPHGVYRCKDASGDPRDRWIAICAFTEEEWRRLVKVMDSPPWANQRRFSTLSGRLANHDALDGLIEAWTREQRAEDLMEILQAAGVPAGLVANAQDFCDRDPHLQFREYWAHVSTPEGKVEVVDGVPSRLSETPGRVAAPGPLLGEHTDVVLGKLLGLSQTQLDLLRRGGVIF